MLPTLVAVTAFLAISLALFAVFRRLIHRHRIDLLRETKPTARHAAADTFDELRHQIRELRVEINDVENMIVAQSRRLQEHIRSGG